MTPGSYHNLPKLQRESLRCLRNLGTPPTNDDRLRAVLRGDSDGLDGQFQGYILDGDICFAAATRVLLVDHDIIEARRLAKSAAVLWENGHTQKWSHPVQSSGGYKSVFTFHRIMKCYALGAAAEANRLLGIVRANINDWVEEGRVRGLVLPACVVLCTDGSNSETNSYLTPLQSQLDDIWDGYFDLFVELCQLLASNASDTELVTIGRAILEGHPYQAYGEHGIFQGFPDDELVCWWLAGLLIRYNRTDAYRLLAADPVLPELLLATGCSSVRD